jgi:hypothetical protein
MKSIVQIATQRLKKCLLFLILMLPFTGAYATTFTPEQKAFFEKNGYLGPLPFLSQKAAEALSKELSRQIQSTPALIAPPGKINETSLLDPAESFEKDSSPPYGQPCYWSKSVHLFLPKVAAIGRSELFLCFLKDLLGPDILLWGAKLVITPPPKGLTITHK